jgi:hypothetical protein
MKKSLLSLLILFLALNAFAHAGHVHTHLGAVTMLHDDGSFMIKTPDGETMHVFVTSDTVYQLADGHPATRADLTIGRRVAVTIATDGKTATLVKLGTMDK